MDRINLSKYGFTKVTPAFTQYFVRGSWYAKDNVLVHVDSYYKHGSNRTSRQTSITVLPFDFIANNYNGTWLQPKMPTQLNHKQLDELPNYKKEIIYTSNRDDITEETMREIVRTADWLNNELEILIQKYNPDREYKVDSEYIH